MWYVGPDEKPRFRRGDNQPGADAIPQVLAVLTEFAGVLGPMIGASRRYDGPLGKSDRAFVFGALGLWVGLGGVLPGWTVAIPAILALLLAVTVANRIRAGLAEARGQS